MNEMDEVAALQASGGVVAWAVVPGKVPPSISEQLDDADEECAIRQINEVRIWLARKGYAVDKDGSLLHDVVNAVRRAEADLGKALSAAGRAPEFIAQIEDDCDAEPLPKATSAASQEEAQP